MSGQKGVKATIRDFMVISAAADLDSYILCILGV